MLLSGAGAAPLPNNLSLENAAVLIVDDEPFIALDLAMAVEDAGGLIVGPAGSVREALALLRHSDIAGAILDVNLSDGDVSPVVEILIERGIPLLLQTGGVVPHNLKIRYPDLLVFAKPFASDNLVQKLAELLHLTLPRAPERDRNNFTMSI